MNKISQVFPWQNIIKFALGELRLDPEVFWKMTPQELLPLYNQSNDGISFDEISNLRQQFPDK